MWMRVRYFNTLYQREVSENVRGEITFKNGRVHFNSYEIAVERLIAIEPIED